MGYMSYIGECVRCHKIFSFNPQRVPSLQVVGQSCGPSGNTQKLILTSSSCRRLLVLLLRVT
jgi:hypothetical protein